MPNELLWFLFIVADLSLLLLAFRLWGRVGIYAFIGGSIIICNIQVLVTIELFGMVATLGNIIYASIFLSTDILNEIYGKKEARRGVWIGFFMLFWATFAMQAALLFAPHATDTCMPHLRELFSLYPRIALASLIAYLLSQHHDIWSFARWREITSGRHLWLRNNISTTISQLIDSIVFTTIAFLGVFPFAVVLEILATTFALKVIVAAVDTPFVYLARHISRKRRQDSS
ncbi:MAG: queuosine precursor transporter [candidate division Zixibacteria bacterium]|nr:queuosine precursor transporter [candidate division Zixibacteria bacterium]